MEQYVIMKFFVKEGVKPRVIFTKDFKHSTVMKLLAAIKHLNGANVLKKIVVNDDSGRGGSEPTAVIPVNIQ